MTEHELHDNKEAKRYEFRIDGAICMVEYIRTVRGDIYLTHTEVPENLEGRGIGSELVRSVLEDIDNQGLKVVPMCTFVALYIKRHPAWRRLVAEGFDALG